MPDSAPLCSDALSASLAVAPPLRATHCFELLRICRALLAGRSSPYAETPHLELVDPGYTAGGVEAFLTDPHDGRRYRLTIEPVRL
jgi:hypothetical protein